MNSSSAALIQYSVIVPAYNSQTTLTSCLESLFRQTVPMEKYEIIVVDDGSSDDTSKVAQQFEVRYLCQANQGPAAARNRGIEAAHGQIVLFTDSDCIPAVDWLEQMVSPFKAPDVVAVKGAYTTKQKEFIARFAQMEFEDRYDLLHKSSFIDMIDTYSAAFRKDIFRAVGSFDSNFPKANNEDTELSYRLATAGCKMLFNPQAIVLHRHPASLKRYLQIKFWRAYWRMIVYRRFPQKAIKDSYTPTSLKVQTLLMAASMPLLVPAFFSSFIIWTLATLWGAILASALPFSLKTYKKDKMVGLMAPGIIFLRSAVFAAGSIIGAARSLFFPNFQNGKSEATCQEPAVGADGKATSHKCAAVLDQAVYKTNTAPRKYNN